MTSTVPLRPFLGLLVLGLLAAPLSAQEPSPRDGIETTVRRFYTSYVAGDLDALLALWKPGSPSLAAFRDEAAPILRARCMRLREITIDPPQITGDRATVGVHVVLSKSSAAMPERYDPHSAILELEREGNEWQVAKWTLQEELFVDRLLAAGSANTRQALLQSEPVLVTPALDRALCRRAVLFANQQRFDDVAVLIALVQNIAQAIDDPAGLSQAAGLESILQRLRPERDLAISLQLAYRSVLLAEEASDPEAIARLSLRLGRALYSLDRVDESLTWFQRAFSLRDEVEDDSFVSLAAGQMAQIYSLRRDHHAAMHYSEIARATARDDIARAGAEMNLGGEYALGVGDCGLAIVHLRRSIELARKSGYRDGVPDATWVLAQCYLRLGRDEDALRLTSEALADLGSTPQPESAQYLLGLRSRCFIRRGKLARAEADLLESLRLCRPGENSGSRAGVLKDLAELRLRQRRYTEARAFASEGISHITWFDPNLLLFEAMAERHLGHRRAAYRILRQVIEATEENAAAINDERERQGFFESRVPSYVEMADMLVEDGRFGEALVIAERAKGRLLLDILRDGKLLQYSALTAEERQTETKLERRVGVLNMQSAGSPADEQRAAQPLREARRQLEDYRADLCRKYPRLAQHATPTALSLHDSGALLPGPSAAFVEYFVTEKHLVVFVVTRGGKRALHAHTIPISQRRLESETAALVHALAERDLRFRRRSRRLYDLILGPAAAELKGVKTIAIIPDGPLWQLPFESLVMPDGRFLIERMACFYAPSISVYREMTRGDRPRPSGNFLAFANPLVRRGEVAEAKLRAGEGGPLPDAEREVERIARLFRDGTKLYVGADALESRVKSESGAYDVLHFATHGVLDDNNPMYSHLLLTASNGDSADDGFLETWELMRLDLHAELAVLSACDTARGTVHAGEGLIGMSWALFVAGCSSTVATQWKVPSAAAADLMIDFYREWLHAPANTPFAKAEALRRARLQLLRDGKHQDPYYWSGYVLVGSGK